MNRRRALEEADQLLQLAQDRLDLHPDDQVAAYAAFTSALRAAGHARALGDGEALRERLRAAARTAVAVFELAGTSESVVTELPDAGETTFTDTSAANAWTYVRALYAALAAADEQSIERLSAIEPAELRTEQVETSPLVGITAAALRRLAGRRFDADLRRRWQAALTEYVGSRKAADRYWVAQLACVDRIVDGDDDGLAGALRGVERAEHEWWHEAGRRDDPEALLGLPVLGLRALAVRGP